MKRKRRIKKSKSLAEHRMTKILEDLAFGLDKAIQQLEIDNNLERIKLLMNYENKYILQTIYLVYRNNICDRLWLSIYKRKQYIFEYYRSFHYSDPRACKCEDQLLYNY